MCKDIDNLVHRLRRSILAEAAHLGVISGIMGNPNVEKIHRSFSGNAVHLLIKSAFHESILISTRYLERNGASVSRLANLLEGKSSLIESRRKAQHPDWPENDLEIGRIDDSIKELNNRIKALTKSKIYRDMTIFRDSNIAHRLEISDKIKKLNLRDDEYQAPKYGDLLKFGEQAIELAAEAVRIWTFSVIDWRSTCERYEEYSKEFLVLLPNLSEAERNSNF